MKFRGLDLDREYEVQIQPGGEKFSQMGYNLNREGVEIRLDSPFTSKLFLLTAK